MTTMTEVEFAADEVLARLRSERHEIVERLGELDAEAEKAAAISDSDTRKKAVTEAQELERRSVELARYINERTKHLTQQRDQATGRLAALGRERDVASDRAARLQDAAELAEMAADDVSLDDVIAALKQLAPHEFAAVAAQVGPACVPIWVEIAAVKAGTAANNLVNIDEAIERETVALAALSDPPATDG